MIGCATSSPPLTPVAVSNRKNSPFLGGSCSSTPFPVHAPPTLHLPTLRIPASARAAYTSAAAERERERESEYTTSAKGGDYYYSSSYSHQTSSQMPAFAAAASPSLYDVLGLSSGATVPEIKAAYRRLALSCHPDATRNGEGGASAEQFMRVHAAYSTLSDPEKRAEYDRGLTISVSNTGRRGSRVYQWTASYPAPGAGSATASSSTYSGSTGFQSAFGRRTWETDQCW